MLNRLVGKCVEFHGGYGYMEEYRIARIFRDARVQTIYAGTSEIMLLIISRCLDL
jgi:acyl-CoA dehydrogenase